MEIRRARPEDAGAIAEVHVRTWQAAYEHVFGAERLASVTVERRLPMWKTILNDGQVVSFVAESEADGVVGFATVGASRDEDAQGELYSIYVDAGSWGSDAARSLMRSVLAALRESGYQDAILWVLADNPRARRFYEREGWHDDGGRKRGEFLGLAVEEARFRIEL
ncbi:MAG TPA: GNAT family N-acetyltransferase [Gaiellaceae bacterium]|nr:GNAT family N-acetyltransferase [Gaiellaceae bacterium]